MPAYLDPGATKARQSRSERDGKTLADAERTAIISIIQKLRHLNTHTFHNMLTYLSLLQHANATTSDYIRFCSTLESRFLKGALREEAPTPEEDAERRAAITARLNHLPGITLQECLEAYQGAPVESVLAK